MSYLDLKIARECPATPCVQCGAVERAAKRPLSKDGNGRGSKPNLSTRAEVSGGFHNYVPMDQHRPVDAGPRAAHPELRHQVVHRIGSRSISTSQCFRIGGRRSTSMKSGFTSTLPASMA